MPGRKDFPQAYFDENPYEGLSPEEVYTRLQWGNEPQTLFEVDAPEAMVTLGELAALYTEGDEVDYSEEEAPYLALGADSNRLYIVPKDEHGAPVDVPLGPYVEVCELTQTDYYSDKGGESAYYYHEHEDPYPTLYINLQSGVMIIEPAQTEDGARSYAVGDEGVIG
jgi:hypothetical protein